MDGGPDLEFRDQRSRTKDQRSTPHPRARLSLRRRVAADSRMGLNMNLGTDAWFRWYRDGSQLAPVVQQ